METKEETVVESGRCCKIRTKWTRCKICCLRIADKWTMSRLRWQASTQARHSAQTSIWIRTWCPIWTSTTLKELWEATSSQYSNRIKMASTIRWTTQELACHLKTLCNRKVRITRTQANNSSRWICTINTCCSYSNSSILISKTSSALQTSRRCQQQRLAWAIIRATSQEQQAMGISTLLSRARCTSRCNKRSSSNSWRISRWLRAPLGTSKIKI